MLINKFVTFVAQCKSDCGGLFLAMFKYVEMALLDAINYDESIIHLHKYITTELRNKNICNKAIYVNNI